MPSRAERRAYERMTRNQDPRALPVSPAQKARAERMAQRRATTRAAMPPRTSRSYWIRAAIVAIVVAILAFSLAWPSGVPFALYVGLGVGLLALVAAVALRSLLGRAADAARSAATSPRR